MKEAKDIFNKIKKVVFAMPSIVVYFNDDTKSIAPYNEECDSYDPFTGYLAALVNYVIPEEYTPETIFDSVNIGDVTIQHMYDLYKLMRSYGFHRKSFDFGHNEKMLFLLRMFVKDFNKYENDYIVSVFKLIESNYDIYDSLNPNTYHEITFNNKPLRLQWKTINTNLKYGEQFANQLKTSFSVVYDENYKKASIFRDKVKEDNQGSQLSDDDLMYEGLMIMISQIGELKQAVTYAMYNSEYSEKHNMDFKRLISRFYYGLCLYTTYNTIGKYKDFFPEYISDVYHDNDGFDNRQLPNDRHKVMLSEIDNILFHITKLASVHERFFHSVKNLDINRDLSEIFRITNFIVAHILHSNLDGYFVIDAPE